MTDATNIRKFLTLLEAGDSKYTNPKASADISFSTEETGGKITKVVATLRSYDSGRYTKLGRNLLRIEQAEKDIKVLKEETKAEARELVADLFNAEDAAMTRVVDTVSFLFEMTKDPKPTETYKYAKILEELETHMTPELLTVLETLKEKHKSVTAKAPALKAKDKEAATESLNEGMFDKLKGFFSKLYQEIKAWGVKYDSQLDALKSEAGITESYNVGPDVQMDGEHKVDCPDCHVSVLPTWNGHEGVWECPNCMNELPEADNISEDSDSFYKEIAQAMKMKLDDGLIDAIQAACVTQSEWAADRIDCINRIFGALEELSNSDFG